ncbi:hypothetical protein ACHAW6_005008 [Cyclotella cf. meneghiniana]
MYMELPPGIKTKHGNSKDYVLKLLANLYGQKQAGHVWNQHMIDKLCDIVFQQSQIDECIVYRNVIILIVYVNDVGVNIKRHCDGTYKFTQRALINSIIDDVDIDNSYTKPVPAKVSLQLPAFCDSPKFDGNFNYHPAMVKLNYIGLTTRPNILYVVHQAAKNSADPRLDHGEAIVYLVKYLKAIHHIGLRFKPDVSKGFQCYCNADFAGNWNKEQQ